MSYDPRAARFHAPVRISPAQRRVAAAFSASGWTRQAAAAHLGVSPTMLRCELRGARVMPPARLKQLAALLRS